MIIENNSSVQIFVILNIYYFFNSMKLIYLKIKK